MRIENLALDTCGSRGRFSAHVVWEDSDRRPVDLFFEVPGEFAPYLSGSANAFLVGTIFPAADAGERRVAVDGSICPRVRLGLLSILGTFRQWYGSRQDAITIEAKAVDGARLKATPPRAGAFFTGGIDSLATLRRNRLLFPATHPDFVRDAVVLYGNNFDSDDSPATFARAVAELSAVTREADAELIPVSTNLRRELDPGGRFFAEKYQAAVLGATAHALGGRLTTMSIASSHDVPHLIPWGSHPLVDPNFGGFDMRIYHDSLELSRLEKTRLVAEWETGLQHIKVCVANWPGVNCGRCEKCVRTMLALIALRALERSDAFSARDVTEEMVRSIRVRKVNQASFYGELIDPLRSVGRHDLARGVEVCTGAIPRRVRSARPVEAPGSCVLPWSIQDAQAASSAGATAI